MNIPDMVTLEKYRNLINNDPPVGEYVNLNWDENSFPNNLKKVIYSFRCQFIYKANIKKLRSIIRYAKIHNG